MNTKILTILVALFATTYNLSAQTSYSSFVHFRNCFTTYSERDSVIGCGLPFTWYGTKVTAAGDWQATIKNKHNCDSIMTLHLTVEDWSNDSAISVDIISGQTYKWNGTSYTIAGQYQQHFTNVRGCDSTVTLTLNVAQPAPGGGLDALFSVGENKQVYFSKSNLIQQTPNKIIYLFDNAQYTYFGNKNNSNNQAMSGSSYNYMDMYAWPGDIYYNGIQYKNNLNVTCTVPSNTWRLLSQEEWNYLFTQRLNANNLYGYATINEGNGYFTKGIVILPDLWELPLSQTFTSVEDATSFGANNYSLANWALMEAAGAVFLPAGGYRYKDMQVEIREVQTGGYYWSSIETGYNNVSAFYLKFSVGELRTDYSWQKTSHGCLIRLVADKKPLQ